MRSKLASAGTVMPMTISTRQFRTIMRIVASPDDPDCVEPLPWSILRSLHELIRCDSVVFTMFDARRHEIILGQDVGEPADVPDDQWTGLHRAFWTHYWDSPQCCYPDVSGDVATVTTASDFYSDRQLHSTAMYSEYLRHIDGEREMMLCLPSEPGRVLRLLFWRGPGLDFTQRDRDLLTVLRPHLYAAFLAQKRRHESAPSLTPRQQQLLRLVAAGHTNGQIARRLSISEATVRKHLEHIFARLRVDSRTEAVTRALSTQDS